MDSLNSALDYCLKQLMNHACYLDHIVIKNRGSPGLCLGPESDGLVQPLKAPRLEIVGLHGFSYVPGFERIVVEEASSSLKVIVIPSLKLSFSDLASVCSRYRGLRHISLGLMPPATAGGVKHLHAVARTTAASSAAVSWQCDFSHATIFPGATRAQVRCAIPQLAK